jgi:hypothetical protein
MEPAKRNMGRLSIKEAMTMLSTRPGGLELVDFCPSHPLSGTVRCSIRNLQLIQSAKKEQKQDIILHGCQRYLLGEDLGTGPVTHTEYNDEL